MAKSIKTIYHLSISHLALKRFFCLFCYWIHFVPKIFITILYQGHWIKLVFSHTFKNPVRMHIIWGFFLFVYILLMLFFRCFSLFQFRSPKQIVHTPKWRLSNKSSWSRFVNENKSFYWKYKWVQHVYQSRYLNYFKHVNLT